MILQVFAIYDMKMGAYLRPFYMNNEAVAMRAFGEYCTAEDSQIKMHPHDYCLYSLGYFDSERGDFFDMEKKSLCGAVDFMTNEEISNA